MNQLIMLRLTEQQIEKCKKVWDELLVGEDRDTINYLELKVCLEKLDIEFEHMNVFHKLLTEIN